VKREIGHVSEERAVAECVRGVVEGDRRLLAKAITLVESMRREDAPLREELLARLLPRTGCAVRVGITGTPGVGKSTFIEALGLFLVGRGERVSVLAVDPSSPVSGGSILGDKTRMEQLAQHPEAFIRPSPSGGSLGGVANRTREALLVCEAAGFGVALVETVGIGQSEIVVSSMVDSFCVLLQPGAGDALQGMKKGVLELADVLAVNKADGEQKAAAERARDEYARALGLFSPGAAVWTPRVLAVSAREKVGIDAFWETLLAHREALLGSGELENKRRRQARAWMWSLIEQGLQESFREHREVKSRIAELERAVEEQRLTPAAAAQTLLELFRK